MSKHIIIPGLAKSGTTFLFDQLSKNKDVFNLPKYKETNSLITSRNKAEMLSFWNDNEKKEGKWFLDASPVYLNNDQRFINNAKLVFNDTDNIKVVICIRNPFEQIYSHYLHDLKSHWTRLDKPLRVRNFSLLSQAAIKKYFKCRSELIAQCISFYGRENVYGLNKASVYSSASHELLSDILDSSLIPFDFSQRSNPGGWMPKIIYHRSKDSEIVANGEPLILPKGVALVANGDRSRIYHNLDPHWVSRVIVDSQSWTDSIAYTEKYFSAVFDDYYNICDQLNITPEESKKEVIQATPPSISDTVIAEIKSLSN